MDKFTGADIVAIFPTLLWVGFAFVALLLFNDPLQELLRIALWRVKTGSQIKIASLELGASYVSQGDDLSRTGGLFEVREDKENIRYEERRSYYEPNQFIFLVHKIAPSKDPQQLYDILIYLIPHHQHSNGLRPVYKVEYYFGRSWGNSIFTSIDRANNFAISTSAYGPFVCTAELYFADERPPVMISHYIDFEMGAIGKEIPYQKKDSGA